MSGVVVVDRNTGVGDETVYFSWNPEHKFISPLTFNYIVRLGRSIAEQLTVRAVQ